MTNPPGITLGLDGNEVRIAIVCPTEAEALAIVQYVRQQLALNGRVNIPIVGTPDDVVGTMQ